MTINNSDDDIIEKNDSNSIINRYDNKINHGMNGYFFRTNDFRKNNGIENDDINNKNI